MFNKFLKFILIAAIVLGIIFRFYNLDRKIYWHDEVYTIFRSGGFTRSEIDRELFTNKLIPARDLRKFLAIKPGSKVGDTLVSLATEDPQHPPLFFIVTRYWMRLFGNSIFAIRLLPALISLVSLPLIYLFVLEIFSNWVNSKAYIDSDLIGLISVALLALSPVDILFAQTARQYSTLTLGIIVSAYFFVKVIRLQNLQNWIYFSLFTAFSFYIHPFFALNLFAFGLFLLLCHRQQLLPFIFFLSGGLLLYLPWIFVLFNNVNRALSTTNWATIDMSFDYLIKLWVLSFTSLFFDLDFGFNNIFTYVFRLPFLFAIILGFFYLVKNNSKNTSIFILTSSFIPFLLLVSADLFFGGKRSAVTRYLISCFPFVQITVAYLFVWLLKKQKTSGLCLSAVFLIASLSSIWVSSQAVTWWNKDLSYNNASIIQTVNQEKEPIVVSDLGNDFTNTGDLIAMSINFNPDVRLFLISPERSDITKLLSNILNESESVFVFRPSQLLLDEVKESSFKYKFLY